jgi:hypothetical protein
MDSYRKIAISAGVLFIIATGADMLSFLFLGPRDAADYLVAVSANRGLIGTGALLLFIGGAAATGVAISLYPLLKRFNAGLALGSLVFRTFEGVLRFVAVSLGLLLLITLSQQFVDAGAPDSSYFQTLGALLVAGYRWVSNVGALLAFSIGCLLYYIIFYRTQLVPRWLSVWGIVGAILTMASALSVMLGLFEPMSTGQIVMNLPIMPQEMVLAAWLIVKGFNPSAIASLSAKVSEGPD